MSDQEFTARLAKLIPSPSEAVNSRLLDFANSLWFGLKEDLFHTFLFVSHHFTPEVLQSVYELYETRKQGALPWELVNAAIYIQAGTPPKEISEDDWDHFAVLPTPETPDMISTLAICTVQENGRATRFYTRHFGQFDPLKLLYRATALAIRGGSTVTAAMQQLKYEAGTCDAVANCAISGPESLMVEKLTTLMASSPITAAHITIDVDSGNVITEMNPLWERLRDELKPDPFVQRKSAEKKRFFSRKHQPER